MHRCCSLFPSNDTQRRCTTRRSTLRIRTTPEQDLERAVGPVGRFTPLACGRRPAQRAPPLEVHLGPNCFGDNDKHNFWYFIVK
jgi:hypothetical protein